MILFISSWSTQLVPLWLRLAKFAINSVCHSSEPDDPSCPDVHFMHISKRYYSTDSERRSHVFSQSTKVNETVVFFLPFARLIETNLCCKSFSSSHSRWGRWRRPTRTPARHPPHIFAGSLFWRRPQTELKHREHNDYYLVYFQRRLTTEWSNFLAPMVLHVRAFGACLLPLWCNANKWPKKL